MLGPRHQGLWNIKNKLQQERQTIYRVGRFLEGSKNKEKDNYLEETSS
jgi:hypothetical protein